MTRTLSVTRPRTLLTAAVVATFALAGCTADGETEAGEGTTQEVVTTDGSAPQQESPAAAGDGQATGPVERFTEPLATTTIPSPQGDGDMTIEVLDLKRRGQLVFLNATITRPQVDEDQPNANAFSYLGGSPVPTVIDPINLKQHRPVETESGPLGPPSEGGAWVNWSTASGGTWTVSATFAAPPEDVTHLDVQLGSNLPVFTEVPLQ
ncbi:MAG: hypothetical protein Q4G43_03455 [Mobilicoccus sp.]|nr:hypothetical protein [Mobilicoccus sp.]